MKQLKQDLKVLAAEIRSQKSQRKQFPNGVVPGLYSNQWQYRYMHIAYCLMRGRTMEQIENKNREGNAPVQFYIEKFMNQYKEISNETLCVG